MFGAKNDPRKLFRRSAPRRAALLAVLVLSLVTGYATGAAQAQDTAALENYLERTGELLLWARDLVQETENRPARQVLTQAGELHRRSLELAAGERPVRAYEVGRRARTAVWHAVKLAREAMNYEERVRIRQERFRDQHQTLAERAREMRSEAALKLVRQAENHAQRARERTLQGETEMAFEMLEQAEQLLQRVRRLLEEGASPDRLRQDLDRTRILIDRTREGLGESPRPEALDLLNEAEAALDRAREHLAQGHPVRAGRQAAAARQLAKQAAEGAGSGARVEAVERQIASWDERSAQLEPKIQEDGSRQATEAYRQALDHRRRAGESLAAGKNGQALRQIRAAHDHLDRARKLLR